MRECFNCGGITLTARKGRRRLDVWHFERTQGISHYNFKKFFNPKLLRGNGSFHKSAILDWVPSPTFWYWQRGATYIICAEIIVWPHQIVDLLFKIFWNTSCFQKMMYFWIFYGDLLNSESHQTQNKRGKGKVGNLISDKYFDWLKSYFENRPQRSRLKPICE